MVGQPSTAGQSTPDCVTHLHRGSFSAQRHAHPEHESSTHELRRIARQDAGWPSWRTIASTRCTPLPAASGLHRTVSRARPTATAAASTGRASRHPPRSRAHTSSASQEAPASASASRNSPPSRPVTMAPSPVRRANLSRPGWALSSGGGRSGTVGTHGSVLTRWSANGRTNPVRVTHMSVTRPGRPQDGAAHGSDWPPP